MIVARERLRGVLSTLRSAQVTTAGILQRAIRVVVGCSCALTIAVAAAGPALASQAHAAGPSSGAPAASPFVLACPSVSSCVAADHVGNLIQWNGLSAAAGPTNTLQPVDTGNAITGIACPLTTLCVAVDSGGNVLTSSDPTDANSSWHLMHVVSSSFTGLSCPTTTLCVASAMGGDVAASTSPATGAWTVSQIDSGDTYECFHYGGTGPGCAASLTAIACSSATACVAVDDAGHTFASSDPAGGPSGWTGNSADSLPEDEAYNSVACPSETFCLLTDSYAGDVATWHPGEGSPTASAHLFGTQAAGVACQSASLCFAYGSSGSFLQSSGPTGPETSWTAAASASSASPITGVACPPSPTACFAIDTAGQLLTTSTSEPAATSSAVRGGRRLAFKIVGRVRVRRPGRLVRPSPPRLVARELRIEAEGGPRKSVVTVVRQLRGAPAAGPRSVSLGRLRVLSRRLGSAHAAAAAGSNPTYGIADAQSECASTSDWYASNGVERCSLWSYGFASYYQNGFNYFTALKSALPLGYVRFFVPYDAIEYWDTQTGSCQYSPALSTSAPGWSGKPRFAAQEWWTLYNELQDAKAIGLTPLVSLVGGTGVQPPSGTQTGSSTGGIPQYPVVNSYGTDADDYECGVEGLLAATTGNSLPVTHWEAFNEPDAVCQYNNGTKPCNQTGSHCSGSSGGDQAAGLYVDFYITDQEVEGRHGDTDVAGVFTHPSVGYFNDYVCYVTKYLNMPSVWSYHDYDDVGSYHAVGDSPLAFNFDDNLWFTCADSQYCPSQPTVWITETATDTTSISTTFSNGASTSGCSNGDNDNMGYLGACIDGSTVYQSAGGSGFLNLASQASYVGGQITQVDWYQFQAANGSSGFDTGLMSPQAPYTGELKCPQGAGIPCYYVSPDSQYSQPRQSYCVLRDISPSNCSSSVTDAEDWSTNPGPPGN
jgi:hypothetical protein